MKTRRGGNKAHLRRLVREFHNSNVAYNPYLGVESQPEPSSEIQSLPEIASVESVREYRLAPIEGLENNLYPVNLPESDPRRRIYLCQRRSTLRLRLGNLIPGPRVRSVIDVTPRLQEAHVIYESIVTILTAPAQPEIIDLTDA
ncbi:hypothetical protein KM043_000174 [Ampulex compressa]|nr:hypothetical protein KM043_000174 [Ampulex compressa]